MQKTTIIFIGILIIILQSNNLFGQNFEWAKNAKIPYAGEQRIAVDKLGNSFVFGNFRDSCRFGSLTLTGDGTNDIYLAKYNSLGLVQWVNKIGGFSNESAEDICLDNVGNIYLTGHYQSTTNFNGLTLPGNGSFVAKYSPSGSVIWVHSIDSLQGTYSHRLVVSDSGNIFVTGTLYAQTNFGCSTLTPSIYENQFIVRLDSTGNCQWAEMFITPYVFDITVDKNNCTYVTGVVMGQGTFGTHTVLSHGGQDIYLAKCNSNGTWDWVVSAGSTDFDQGLGVTADKYGHIYFTGYFTSTATFGTNILTTSVGASDIFTACYNDQGNCLWVKQAGGGHGNHYSCGITTDIQGNCIITGDVSDTAHFDNCTFIADAENAFIAKYDSTGNCKWVTGSKGYSGQRGLDINTDTLDNIYLTGAVFNSGSYSFGTDSFNIPYTLTCINDYNACTSIFVVKINSNLVNVKEIDKIINNISVFPNPVASTINIFDESNQLQNATIEITNYLGQNVYSTPYSNQIDLQSLSAGLYFLTVKEKSNKKTFKIVKE